MTEPSCFGEDNGTINITKVLGGTAPYLYSINNGPFTPYKNFVNLKAGIYTIRIKDGKGCEYENTVKVTQPDEIDVTVPEDVDLELGEDYTIQAQINFPDSLLKRVTWVPSCDSCITAPKNKSLTYKVKPNETTLYTVTVVNKNGCTSNDNILLRVNKPRRVFIPNVFYPDSDDDRNRKLKVFLGIDVLKVHYFRIFDRWGNAVYEEFNFNRRDVANSDKGWDGKFRGQLSIPGVYTYACLVEFIDGYKEVYKGDVLLVEK
jgi:SprB repeat/CHU_C Type IX secretion signal domain